MPANPPEARFVLGLAYQCGPDPRIQRGADGGRDYFTADELEKACWSFGRGPREVGIQHIDGTQGAATVVENFIWRAGPTQFGDVIVKNGDWVVGAILDEPAWELYKAGKITGFSPQGAARRRQPGA